jgi:uncharacterized protein (TIGR03435 family)
MKNPMSVHQSNRRQWLSLLSRTTITTVLSGVLIFATQSHGQTSTSGKPESSADATRLTFDVVSIKRNNTGPGPVMIISPLDSDRILIGNAPLRHIIEAAYTLTLPAGAAYDINLHDQIVGLPGWADSETYDIEAKIAEADGPAFRKLLPMQRNPMLQTILATRFHLVCHFETRTLPVYALVVTKSGPKLKPVQPAILPDGRKDPGGIKMSRNEITATGASMPPLLHVLQMQLGRPVVDRTGLTGNYDFTLNWTPSTADAESGPSIFTALQEQLGLKLQPVKAPIPILVVDHIERPSEN